MSYKSLLLEKIQKTHSLQAPLFYCLRTGGTDHEPVFSCTITWNQFQTYGIGSSKKEAENVASQNFIQTYKWPSTVYKTIIDPLTFDWKQFQHIILVDGDNISKSIDPPSKKYTYIFIYAKQSTKISVYTLNESYVCFTPTTGKDGTDHYISYMMGIALCQNKNIQIQLLTNDHFGEVCSHFHKQIEHQTNV